MEDPRVGPERIRQRPKSAATTNSRPKPPTTMATVSVERLTERRVVAFLSANQASPGIACELFFPQPVGATP